MREALIFHITNRRYTGAKTKLLQNIDSALSKNFDYESKKNLKFFDVFGGTGVVSAYFCKKLNLALLLSMIFYIQTMQFIKAFLLNKISM